MATFSRELLSASANGAHIVLTTSLANIHVPPAGTSSIDEVYLWASNLDSVPRALSVTIGGSAAADQICNSVTLPALSLPIPILTGQCLQNSKQVMAQLTTAGSRISVTGYVNRITK